MASHRAIWATFTLILLTVLPLTAQAQVFGADAGSPLALVALLAGLALLPFALILMTSFVKVAVVLSILRTAIGAQQVPPNQIITGLAIVLSVYIMAPVGEDMYELLQPHVEAHEEGELTLTVTTLEEVGAEVGEPLRQFLLRHADQEDRLLLHELALEMRDEDQRQRLGDEDFLILVPAFVVSELKRAFTIGFIIFVPFIIIDLVVANILLSLGMHMLSPTTISLPFKLLLFVLVDGWYLVVQGLILGYV